MPIVIPTGFSQVTLDFQIPAPGGTKIASTTFGVGTLPSAALLDGILDSYNTTVWQVVGSTQCTMVGGTIRDALFTYEAPYSEPGSVATALAPPNVSVLVKKVTVGAGRKNRGRLYPPGIAYDNTFNDGGEMTITDAGEYTAAFENFREAMQEEPGGMVILHNDETAPTPIVALQAERVAATQRRRLR